MVISIGWDNPEKSTIRYDFGESWTWEDLWIALRADDELISSVDHTVHLIFNFQQTRFFPPHPGTKFRTIADHVSDRIGLILLVGSSAWLLTVSQMFINLYGHKIKSITGIETVFTLEGARAVIANYSPQIGVG